MEEVITQSLTNKFNQEHENWKKLDIFYSKIKGLAYMSIVSNKIHTNQINSLKAEAAKRDQLIDQLTELRNELFSQAAHQQNTISSLEKKILKLKQRESTYKKINSIHDIKEKTQELIKLSDQTFHDLQNRISHTFSKQKVKKTIHYNDKNNLVLNKNGTYYFYPTDTASFYQNAKHLFLSIVNEPLKNIPQKVNELLYQFDVPEAEISTAIYKYQNGMKSNFFF